MEERDVRMKEAKARILEEAKARLKAVSAITGKVGKERLAVEEVQMLALVVAQVKALAVREGVDMPLFAATVGMTAGLPICNRKCCN